MAELTAVPQPSDGGSPAMSSGDFWSEAARLRRIARVIGEARMQRSPLARSLPVLLLALDWSAAPQVLLATLPAVDVVLQPRHLEALLEDLGFFVETITLPAIDTLDAIPVGTLAIGDDYCHVYLGRQQGKHCWHDGVSPQSEWQPKIGQQLLLVRKNFSHIPASAPVPNWFMGLVARIRPSLVNIVFISLVINLLALFTSLFTMTVYNHVIPSGATGTLWSLGVAALIAAVAGWLLRTGRGRALARIGAWAGSRIGQVSIRKTLGLALEQSGRVGANNNLNRMRMFENARQFLGGTAGLSLIDYPFVIIFLVVIGFLGGWIVLVPIAGLVLFFIASLSLQPQMQQASEQAGRLSNRLQEEYAMAIRRLRSLQGVGGNDHLLRRLQEIVLQVADANRRFAMTTTLVQTVAQAIGMLTVLGTMGIGVLLVLQGVMTTGGLIASMMLIWRITTPAQQFFTTSANFRQLRSSVQQLDNLMLTSTELLNPHAGSAIDTLNPQLSADRVYYRYAADREPALNSISFDIPGGSRVVVAGPNGAGKTTMLQCLAGLRQPQSGRIMVEGRDIRQFDPSDYRAWLSYLSQQAELLPMTPVAWLQLSHPAVDEPAICDALVRVAGEQWWLLLGFESAQRALSTPMDPWRDDSQAQRSRYIFSMVEVLLDQPRMILLDDPLRDRDPQLDPYLQRLLDELRGITTVVIATHRADLIRSADLIVILDRGNLLHVGPVVADDKQAIDNPEGN